MRYITYNGTKLSKLSLGTVQFGLSYGIANTSGQPTQNEVNEIVDYVDKEGINCYDTAQAYGNSEKVLGEAISSICQKFVISKLKSDLFENNVLENIENSINNLNINILYALLLHDSEMLYKWNSKHSSLVQKLIECEKIKYFGVSIYTSKDFDLAIESSDINFIQIPFNIFDQRALNENWFQRAKEANKLIFIRSIYLQGLLLMDMIDVEKKLPDALPYVEKLDILCKKYNYSRNELAISFVDTVAQDSLLLFGCDNLTQATENINNYNNLNSLSDSLIEEIRDMFVNISENIYNPTKW